MAVNQKQSSTPLFQVMQQQLTLIQDYCAHLERIKQAITQNEIDSLSQLLLQSELDIKKLQQSQQQLALTLQDLGFKDTQSDLTQAVEAYHDNDLSKLHQALSDALKQFENTLLINDLLIRKNQQRVRQSIRILSGHNSNGSPDVYSRKGNKESNDEQRSIAMA